MEQLRGVQLQAAQLSSKSKKDLITTDAQLAIPIIAWSVDASITKEWHVPSTKFQTHSTKETKISSNLSKELNSNNVLSANTGSKGFRDALPWLANVDKSFAMYVEVPLVLMEDVLILQKE